MFEPVVPNRGLRIATMNPERVAMSIQRSQRGHPKITLLFGRAALHRLGVAIGETMSIEVDRIQGHLRVTKGSDWRLYKWGESGSGNVQIPTVLAGIPAVPHPVQEVTWRWDADNRLLVALPAWAKPVPKVNNGKAA